jgi:hypothetical protein
MIACFPAASADESQEKLCAAFCLLELYYSRDQSIHALHQLHFGLGSFHVLLHNTFQMGNRMVDRRVVFEIILDGTLFQWGSEYLCRREDRILSKDYAACPCVNDNVHTVGGHGNRALRKEMF